MRRDSRVVFPSSSSTSSALAGGSSESAFGAELEERVYQVQAALRRLVEAWGSPPSASELDRRSGAGITICWQVFRIVNATEVLAEGRHIPSPSSLKGMLKAAGGAGVPEDVIEAVKEAAEGFRAFAKRVSRDKASFNSMLAGASSGEKAQKILNSERRAVFRGMSHITGVQVDVLYYGYMMKRAEVGDGIAGAMFFGQQGLRRLRPDARCPLFGYHQNPNGVAGQVQGADALDKEAMAEFGMPVLPGFSTQPLPKIEKRVAPSGFVLHDMVDTEVGAEGSVDFTIGRGWECDPYMVEEGVEGGKKIVALTFTFSRKPIGLGVMEMLVHRPSYPNARPQLMVCEAGTELSMEGMRQARQYPVEEKLVRVGRADLVGLPEVSGYGELMRYGAETTGWNLAEFDVWRVKMPYPIWSSAVRIWFVAE